MYGNSNKTEGKYGKDFYIFVSNEEMAKHPEEQRARELAIQLL